ncbi:hypothetical protein [Pelosinus fermentans]|uniref:Uncharacterized protein n=1 Tax=Pelosinus fermentans JBW45 TaxID=1192197 RepID=I9NM72_9FIRM|nr:hypothetical protein [Pelosinus fermentans]AJQ26898.1 hypothetical protein JBW_01548 [Pelosinus fermentans JBW45]
MSIKQNVLINTNGRVIKVQFEHCQVCKYVNKCYEDGQGPRYIDQDCVSGPAFKDGQS